MNPKEPIYKLSDIASEAQANIQRDFSDIDPIIGLMRNLRKSGFAADAMTIDSLVTGKRILLILHDDKPEQLAWQWCYRDKDPAMEFNYIALASVLFWQINTPWKSLAKT